MIRCRNSMKKVVGTAPTLPIMGIS
uniref:Uncharacterized protein n=1 Tax=Arundo donax TaxID=35708 RepID=A0A0A9AID9_ARUDO